MDDDVGIERPDERDRPCAIAWVDPMEFRPAQAPAGRVDVQSDDLGDVPVDLEQLRDASAELAAHAGDQESHPLNPVRAAASGTR